MTLATSLLVNKMLSLQLGNPRYGTNHDIYDKRLLLSNPWTPFVEEPHVVYFYYLRFDTDGMLTTACKAYTDGPDPDRPAPNARIPHDRVPAIIKWLALKARKPGTFPAADLDNMRWDHKSYIAFFVDETSWQLHKRPDGKSAVVFNTNGSAGPNLSFFDAADVDVEMPISGTTRVDTRTAIYFVNHMKRDAEGNDLRDEDQPFQFDMFFNVTFAGAPTLKTTVILDPGGTNDGPPLQP
jgi:hypothetical protein